MPKMKIIPYHSTDDPCHVNLVQREGLAEETLREPRVDLNIKLLVTSIKSAVKAAEHEQIALKKKAEAAEKVLKDAAEHTAVETQQAPRSPEPLARKNEEGIRLESRKARKATERARLCQRSEGTCQGCGLTRSPPQQTKKAEEQRQAVIPRRLTQVSKQGDNNEQKPPTNNGWNVPQQQLKIQAAKNWAEELHEFVDKKHNDTPGVIPEEPNKSRKEKIVQPENTPASLPKRHRSSPGDERPGGSKKQRDGLLKRMAVAEPEETGDSNRRSPWQVVQKKTKKNRINASERQNVIKRSVKKKGEAILVKTSEEGYLEVLRTIRTAPELKDFGADVQKIRRTRAGDMIFELKKDSKNKSSSYKELTERVVGDKAQVRAMAPELNLQCVDLDEITTADDVIAAMKEQFNLGDVEITIRLRRGPSGTQVAGIKLPVDAAEKALKIGKVKVGWSVCSLSLSQQPEVCFRCQEFGHLARNCKGPDRSKLCRRCGEDGHKAQSCNKPPKCLICMNDGCRDHITGGQKCPAYKQAMSDTAQQLLWQSARESRRRNWVADDAGTAAICTVGRYPFQDIVYRAAEGFVIAKVNGVYICSCYAPPRWTSDQFNQMLDTLVAELTDRRPVVIAGDFNAWALEWGSRLTNQKSPALTRNINWRVCEGYTHSDHQAVRYCVGEKVAIQARECGTKELRWKTETFNKEVLAEAIRFERNLVNLSPDELVAALTRACDATMPRKVQPRHVRRPVYWWNGTIAELRRNCLRARRRMQRARNNVEREERRLSVQRSKSCFQKGN
ncbi:uncharacterized protein LOC134206792 [Armigeres subalbatus]|uniref:uncharacterized protein LOC134206792 n=1 Tax=Armigeres subalbatus TaxID=124917 RepID=UPI002ED15BD4